MTDYVLRLKTGVTLDLVVRFLADDLSGLEIHHEPDSAVWIRYRNTEDPVALSRLSRVAGDRFRVDGNDLYPVGASLAVGTAPVWNWQSLEAVATIDMPRLDVAGVAEPASITLSWVADDQTRQPQATICRLSQLLGWIESVPVSRVLGLSWIKRAIDGHALVRRDNMQANLPPIRGELLVDHGKVLMTAGHTWCPELPVADLRRVMGATKNQCVLWLSPESMELLDESWWIALDRSSVRLTSTSSR